jgi:hypothetical protein
MKSLKSARTVVGGDVNPKNLHAYGDLDGQGTMARLQHPIAVHFIQEKNVVAVADTYNHKIKVIDPFRNEIYTWLGNGKAALKDENTFNASFNEPSGFASLLDKNVGDIKLYIADCNNHCIRSVFYDQGELKTLDFKGIPPVDSTGSADNDGGETEGTTNKSAINDEDLVGGLECDGSNCYPKFY